tara:strand:- start:4325 stop:4516 length:192 start_codon:yes stop_codon:yes gene_type:complete
MDPTIALLSLLTVMLLPWMAWLSKILISIQIRLARGEENFDRVNSVLEDHEARLRTLETSGYH